MRERLGFFEKLLLRRKGRQDSKKNAFFACPDPNANVEVYSAFICTELVRLGVDARHIFNQRWCTVVLRKDNGRSYRRFLRLSEALAQIESCVAQLEVRIQEICLRHRAPAESLMRQCKAAKEAGAPHMEALYAGRLTQLASRQRTEVAQLSRGVEYLLEEKKRILRSTFSRYDVVRSKRFLRIQYYYQAACEVSRNHGPELLRMRDYETLMDTTIQTHYQEELDSIQERLQETNRKVLSVFSPAEGG